MKNNLQLIAIIDIASAINCNNWNVIFCNKFVEKWAAIMIAIKQSSKNVQKFDCNLIAFHVG